MIEALGCDTQRVDITPMADPMLALIGDGEETATRCDAATCWPGCG